MFQTFWDHQSGKIDEPTWKARFASGKRAAHLAWLAITPQALLGVLFNRLYTLRNHSSMAAQPGTVSVNREQMRDCTSLLGKLMPLIIELMMDSAIPCAGCLLSGGEGWLI